MHSRACGSYGVFLMYTLLLTLPFVGSLNVYDDVFFVHKASLAVLQPPSLDAQAAVLPLPPPPCGAEAVRRPIRVSGFGSIWS